MATIAQIEKPKSNFEPLSAGYHDGEITKVEARNFDQNNFNTGQPETVTKLVVVFESDTAPKVDGERAQGRLFLRLAYGDKAHLTIVRERLLNRALTPEEMTTVDEDEFVGKKIRVQVKHKTSKNGQVYGNLDPTSVMLLSPLPQSADTQTDDEIPF